MNTRLTFSEVYSTYSRMVYNFSLNYLQNREDAEEVTQDIFLKVYSKLADFKEESSLKTWIYSIAINTCKDHIKAQQRKKRLLFSLFSSGAGEELIPDFEHPGVKLENKEVSRLLFSHINTLPENQKTAFLLKYSEDMSVQEIAESIGISTKASESLLSRAREKLRDVLLKNKGLSIILLPKIYILCEGF